MAFFVGSKQSLTQQTSDSSLHKTVKAFLLRLEHFLVELNKKTGYARSADVTSNTLLIPSIEEEGRPVGQLERIHSDHPEESGGQGNVQLANADLHIP